MNKTIRATEVNFGSIFDETDLHLRLCLVPSFQRKYVWTKKRIEELVESIEDSTKEGNFFGNLMVQDSKFGGTGSDLIIDGQQRLVTLSLLVLSLKKQLSNVQQAEVEKILFCKKNTPRIKFHREVLEKVYMAILTDDTISDEDRKSADSFIKAVKSIESILDKIDDKKAFYKKLLSSNFVLIKLPQKYAVYSIFESLNSKNTPLKPVELTKNNLLGLVEADLAEHKAIEKEWEALQLKFEKEKRVNEFDTFLRYQSFQKYGNVTSSQLFSRISDDAEVKAEPLKYSQNLNSDADLWLKIRKGNFTLPESSSQDSVANIPVYAAHLQKLNLRQVYAVLFALHKALDAFAEYNQRDYFENDLKKIYSFSWLAKILGIGPQKYEKIYATASLGIAGSEDISCLNKAREKLFDSLSKLVNENEKKKFADNIYERIFYDGNHKKKKPSIYEDSSLISDLLILSQGRKITDGATIEHIIPKTSSWRENWSHITTELNDVRYKLGNFTYLKNDLAGDSKYIDKIEVYKTDEYGDDVINKKLIDQTVEGSHYNIFQINNPRKKMKDRGLEIGGLIFTELRNSLKAKYKKID